MDTITESIKQALIEFLKWIGKGLLYGLVDYGYYIFLFVAIAALILYIGGMKKSAKYVSLSIIIYFFLECIKGVIS